MIRRYNISKMFVDDEHGPLALPGDLRTEIVQFFVRLQTSQSASSGTCVKTLCFPVGLLVLGLLDLLAIKGEIG